LPVGIREEIDEFFSEYMGLDSEVETVMGPQGGEAFGWRVAPQQLPGRGKPTLLADHL
jgi:hypothetical protein